MSASLVPTLLKANPKEVGAIRIDPRSEDTDYRERMRLAFGSDMSAADFAQAWAHRHCDEPAQPLLTQSVMTPERFGRVPRHYFRTLEDLVISIAAQDFMISAVDSAMANHTNTHTFATGHSLHYSKPKVLAHLFAGIAR
jgi:hypothetical protein